jgi:molecular chaperone GrpE (heat shock protein)
VNFEVTLLPMTESKSSLPWWPFLAADALFLALAALLLRQGHRPLLWWEAMLLIGCVAAGAGCGLLPFLRRNQDEQALAQARLLADALNQLQKIEEVAAQIVGATDQWREFRQQTEEVSASTKALAGSIAAEARAFSEFLQKANDSEKAHLRLEAEKLRRAETEWLQVVIHILDHVSALNLAARQSGQPGLMEQIGQFHNGCRDIARRVGLAPVTGREGEPFDPNLHQLKEKAAPVENAVVGETLAPGYTFQGKLVRRALVALKEPAGA